MDLHKQVHNITFAMRKYVLPKVKRGSDAQQCITELLQADKPCMIGRFGSVEIQGVLNGVLPPPINIILQNRTYKYLIANAGFFPVDRVHVKRFAKLMIECMKECDCLGSWRIEEFFFLKYLKKAQRVSLDSIGPVNNQTNYLWYKVLKNKKILVISPFAELIEQQYKNNRGRIWENPDMLPEYAKLETIKAINSIGGKCNFNSWFDALEYMKREIDKKDFDIAILGCGAYGFPLAAYIKSIGKKAIHVGGATQLIFGIKGKRWENASFINRYWISPRLIDRPQGYENVEGGCYW